MEKIIGQQKVQVEILKKALTELNTADKIKIINQLKSDYTVAELCRTFNIPRSTYYYRQNNDQAKDVIQSSKKRNIKPNFSSHKIDEKNLKNTIDVKLISGKYRVEEFQNGAIKVYNKENQKYEAAISILKKIIEEKELEISLYYKSGNEKNTRTLGKAVIKVMKNNKDE
jgi:transposase-like protein